MDLIVHTYGTSISRDNHGFVISNKYGTQRIAADDVNAIYVSKGVRITSDAIMLAIEKEVEFLFTERSGHPLGRVWSSKYGSLSVIRKGQLRFVYSPDAVSWIQDILVSKIQNQQAFLLTMEMQDESAKYIVEKAVSRLEEYILKVKSSSANMVQEIAPKFRGWEGFASRIYFETLNMFLPDRFRFEKRSQHPAVDVVNAMLNYGYGMLYGKIEGMLIKSGVDPYVGVMHRDTYNRPVLVYDIIERYRVWVDYVVYTLVCQGIITDEYYSIRTDGSCWLESLGRRVLIQSLNDYLDEVVDLEGLSRSREVHMFLFIQSFAQYLKNFSM